jgi:hypothetical protein
MRMTIDGDTSHEPHDTRRREYQTNNLSGGNRRANDTATHTVGTESGCSVWYTDPVHIVGQYRSQSRLSRLLLYRTPCTDRRTDPDPGRSCLRIVNGGMQLVHARTKESSLMSER